MASQSKVGNKTKQELLEYINKVRVVITDTKLNCVHVYNDDSKGSSTKVMISDSVQLTGRRMHCNDTFIVVALIDGDGDKGGYKIGNVDDFTKNQCQIVNLSYDVFAIFITNDNKVALGGCNGEVQFDQVDVNGKQTMIWCKKIHDNCIGDIKVHNNKIFTASYGKKCGVITMSDGSVLHMFNAPNCLNCVCVVNDNLILTGCDNGKVYRHDMSTRTTSVFVAPGGSGWNPIYTLALSNDYNILYCGGYDETLYAINMKTNNALLWQTKCENTIRSICVQYGIIYVGMRESDVVCVNEHNGEIMTALTIKPQNNPNGIVMIPPRKAKIVVQNTPKALTTSTPNPSTTITTPSQQITVASNSSLYQIQQLTQKRDSIKQAANEQVKQIQQAQQQAQQDAQLQIQQAQQQAQQDAQQQMQQAQQQAQQDAQQQIQQAQQQAQQDAQQQIQQAQQQAQQDAQQQIQQAQQQAQQDAQQQIQQAQQQAQQDAQQQIQQAQQQAQQDAQQQIQQAQQQAQQDAQQQIQQAQQQAQQDAQQQIQQAQQQAQQDAQQQIQQAQQQAQQDAQPQIQQAQQQAQQDAQQQIQQAQQQAQQDAQQQIQQAQQQAQQDAQQQIQQAQQQAQQQISQLSQQLETTNQKIIVLETENNKFKQNQARDRLNSLITKINNLSGPEVIQIANVFNINLTGVDTTKLATTNMLAHESFDEFFEQLDIDPLLQDSLLRLYSLIKKAQEIGQFPVEHPIAPWIAQQGQPDIAARFAELNYTEEMMVCMDPKVFASKHGFRLLLMKKLQADFIISQTSVPRLIKHDTSSGGVILVPVNPNSPKPSASSSS